jgi:hypothetical protein
MNGRLWLQSAAAQRPAREKPFRREAVKAGLSRRFAATAAKAAY